MTDVPDACEHLFRGVVPSNDIVSRTEFLMNMEEGRALLRRIGEYDRTEVPVAMAMLFRNMWGVNAPPKFRSVVSYDRSLWTIDNDILDPIGFVYTRYDDMDALTKVLVNNIIDTIDYIKSSSRAHARSMPRTKHVTHVERASVQHRIMAELRDIIDQTHRDTGRVLFRHVPRPAE